MGPRLLALVTLAMAPTWACAPRQDRLRYGRLQSIALGREMGYGVYTPPGWDGATPLPLVVFLHGGGDDERCWDRHGATAELDQWISSGRLAPFLMVVPDGELGFWANWYDGSHAYEDYVVHDVIAEVRERYPILPGRSIHLVGMSMGGAGTAYMALSHKQRFASASVISAPLLTAEELLIFLDSFFFRVFARVQRIFGRPDADRAAAATVYSQVRGPEDLEGLRLLIAAGTRDRRHILTSTERFHRHLSDRQVPHLFLVYDGGHRWVDWRPILPAILCAQLGAGGGRPCEVPAEGPGYRLQALGDATGPRPGRVSERRAGRPAPW